MTNNHRGSRTSWQERFGSRQGQSPDAAMQPTSSFMPGNRPRPSLALDTQLTRQRITPQETPIRPSGSRNNPGQRAQNNVLVPAPWQGHRGISVILGGLPSDITTVDIWRSFADYRLTLIEVFEDNRGVKNGRARVYIEPPPKTNPWITGRCTINLKDSWPIAVNITVQKTLQSDQTCLSPLRNRIPIKSTIKLTCLQFGNLVEESTLMERRQIDAHQSLGDLQLTVDFTKRKAHIEFSLRPVHGSEENNSLEPVTSYRISIKFNCLKKLCRVDSDTGDCGILLHMSLPPHLFQLMSKIEDSHSPDKLLWRDDDTWVRQTGFMLDPMEMKERPLRLNIDQFIDVGRWTTYYMKLDPQFRLQWDQIEKHLRDYNLKTNPLSNISIVSPGSTNYWSMVGDVAQNHTSSQALAFMFRPNTVALSFDIRYQMEVCLSKGFLNEHTISYDFLVKLSKFPNDRARMLLEGVVEGKRLVYNPMDIFVTERVLHYYSFAKVPSYCTLMRRAIVTPTTIYFSTPTVEVTNRVLRQYSDLADHFMRVQFTDELSDGRIHASADSNAADELLLRVYHALKNGIIVAGRHYEFLAFGNSQIRENGAYFFCPSTHVSCDDIRKWMGSFDNIRCVAKYAARMGQCFSTTKQVSGFKVPSIVKIPDIEKNGYCFTDGVGKISGLIANVIASDFGLDEAPSVFQFRMGGCKGVLTRWPDVKTNEVHIRESQVKFNADYNSIEIVRCSTYSVATLNRQTITVLSSLGVEDSVFIKMLEDQLTNYEKALQNKVEAMDMLGRYIDQNQMTLIIAQMIINGFMDTHEPFVWTLLRLWKTWSVKALKEKARIIVEKSAFVLGSVDETGILRGYTNSMEEATDLDRSLLPQIFLQVPDPEDRRDYKVITGVCLVGRNPSLHPGDLRVVEAVDVPALRHLKDTVVFSQNGDRDVPSMCSGGDLDGDDFFVFWDENLIPPEWNHPPMDHAPSRPEILDRDVDMNDIIRFFTLYIKNDSLPHIAHAHLAQADRLESENGGDDSHAKHPKCLELAALHSKAVDYVKSGVPAEMSRRLQPTHWPHFMEKRGRTYQSKQVLGQIYDRVYNVEFEPAYEMPFDKRVLAKFKLDKDILRKARQVKSRYDTAMRQLMGQNEITTEFEAWSAFVLTKPLVGNDYKRQEDVGRESSALKLRFVTLCMEAAGIKDRSRDPEVLDPFVAAMYQVTNEEVQIARYKSKVAHIGTDGCAYTRELTTASMPLISFPWLFYRELGRIVSGRIIRFTFGDYSLQSAEVQPPTQTRRESLGVDELEDMEYTHTSDGKVMHRGEILNLFDHMDEDDKLPVKNVEAETPRLDKALENGESSNLGRNTAQVTDGDLPKSAVIFSSPDQSVNEDGHMIDKYVSKDPMKENSDNTNLDNTRGPLMLAGPSSITHREPLHPNPPNQTARADSTYQTSSSQGLPFKPEGSVLRATSGTLSGHVPGAGMTPTRGIEEMIEDDEDDIEDEIEVEADGETTLERAARMLAL